MRQRTAFVLFCLSSWLIFLGKAIRSKDKSIIVDALTLPGWFIVDENITQVTGPLETKHLKNGFTWKFWDMPDEYIKQMRKLKTKYKR